MGNFWSFLVLFVITALVMLLTIIALTLGLNYITAPNTMQNMVGIFVVLLVFVANSVWGIYAGKKALFLFKNIKNNEEIK